METKHIHFIGICGIAMGSLALAFKNAGWKVTGSDAGFFPPMSTALTAAGVSYYPGWHPEKMCADGQPNLVVVGNVAASTNPEWEYVLENKIDYVSYPQAVAQYFVKDNSIVCAGTYGKTTTSALLAYIFSQAGYRPSYMFGGLAGGDFPSAKISDGQYSILEGDEYKTARFDPRPKFLSYSPTHVLLTAVEWDHADIYPTSASYFAVFNELVSSIPPSGLLVVSKNALASLPTITSTNARLITYGSQDADYCYHTVNESKHGLDFIVHKGEMEYAVSIPIIGKYNAENICGAFALAMEIGLDSKTIISALASFPGLRRRLEWRGQTHNDVPVYDDIAHSPTKAKSALLDLKEIYPGKIWAIFEPNTGNRQPQSAPSYNHAFVSADTVIVPRLTQLKSTTDSVHWGGKELQTVISQSHSNCLLIEDDDELLDLLKQKTTAGDAIVFLGSHGFRGMIEKLITSPRPLHP